MLVVLKKQKVPLNWIEISQRLQIAEAILIFSCTFFRQCLSFLTSALVQDVGEATVDVDAVSFAYATDRYIVRGERNRGESSDFIALDSSVC